MWLEKAPGERVAINDADSVLLGDGWPQLPLFGSWRIENSEFIFTPADDSLMEQVAEQFDYLLLSGLQSAADPLYLPDEEGKDPNRHARETLLKTIKRQLNLLARRGVRLHLELSGIPNPTVGDWIADMISKSVRSAGINQEELETITGDAGFRGSRFFLRERPTKGGPPEPFVRRYERALHLAQQFELDQLYVHGNDADLILVRGVPRGAIWQELMADLLGEGAVVLSILERSVSGWEAEADRLRLVLLVPGFLALLQLVALVARDAFPGNPDKEARLMREVAFQGYWFNRNPKGYSVIVVPVLWPALPKDLATAGAGDAVSAVLAAVGR